MNKVLTRSIEKRYWSRQLVFPVVCLLACLPVVLLAYFYNQAANRRIIHLQALRRIRPVAFKKKEGPKWNKAGHFLWKQLCELERVFKSGLRLDAVDWRGSVLSVSGEAKSLRAYFVDWGLSPGYRLQRYDYKDHPVFKLEKNI